MKKLIPLFLTLCLLVSLLSPILCTAEELALPVIIPNTDTKEVISKIIADSMKEKWQVRSATDYSLVLVKPVENMWGQVFFGSNFNRTPEFRLNFTLVNYNNQLQINFIGQIVTNPGSAFEKYTPMNDNDIKSWTKYLYNLREEFYGAYTVGLKFEDKDRNQDYVVISKVFKDSPAEKFGLKTGMKIVRINSKDLKKLSLNDVYYRFPRYSGGPVTITISEKGQFIDSDIEKDIVIETEFTPGPLAKKQ